MLLEDSLCFLLLAVHGGEEWIACYTPLSLYLSRLCLLSPWYPWGRPCSPGAPRRLGRPPAPPAPVSRTHVAQVLPCSGMAPLKCLFMITNVLPLLPPSSIPCGALGGAAGSCPITISSLRLVVVFPSVSQVAEAFLSPPRPCPSIPGTPFPSRVTLRFLVPLGNSTPPPTP